MLDGGAPERNREARIFEQSRRDLVHVASHALGAAVLGVHARGAHLDGDAELGCKALKGRVDAGGGLDKRRVAVTPKMEGDADADQEGLESGDDGG